MDLQPYFEETKGHGVLATADASGRVNLAIFARPHVLDDEFRGIHHAPPPDP